ncbi:hypothetical protein ACNUDM_11665 [Vibrio chaetopteri]|uniref:hypothetical protein n=1 Tax=Vibrio chaetopteri TaxID=3016528 RepID=UPI003AB15ED4
MFDSMSFKSVTTGARTAIGNAPVSVTQACKKDGKQEQIYRLTREALDEAKLEYKDKVEILYNAESTVCRIQKSKTGSGVTLSQQISNNPNSAAIIRLTFRPNVHPDLLERARKETENQDKDKARYEHKEGRIDYQEGSVTFELELAE